MTNYERISYLKKIGVWDDIVVPLTAKLSTLDRFFKIYSYIKELFEQEKRVLKGWFPMNPKRKDEYPPK